MKAAPAIDPHPDSNYVRLATSKAYRDRQQKLAWLDSLLTDPGSGCREWPWAKNADGYGIIRWDGKPKRVGHVVLELTGRPRPAGLGQLHSCDNPSCVAPWHLRWGTNQENVDDAYARGRKSRRRYIDEEA